MLATAALVAFATARAEEPRIERSLAELEKAAAALRKQDPALGGPLAGPAREGPSAPAPRQELRWRVGGRTHYLRVGPPAATGPLPGLEIPDEDFLGFRRRNRAERPASEQHVLVSVVGPAVSRYTRVAEGGSAGWVTEHIETEWLDGFTFDLRSFLAARGRLTAELALADLDRFAVVDWDGKDQLTLVVERSGCERERHCALRTLTVVVPTPGGWVPWLQAAARGEGLLARRAASWWTARERSSPRAPIR